MFLKFPYICFVYIIAYRMNVKRKVFDKDIIVALLRTSHL